MTALGPGAGAQRGEVGPRAGLGESLTPDVGALGDAAQIPILLRLRSMLEQGRRRVEKRDGEHVEFGRVCARKLFIRSEEHTSELQSLMRISYAVFCLKKTKSI